jgi:hypothetical protein
VQEHETNSSFGNKLKQDRKEMTEGEGKREENKSLFLWSDKICFPSLLNSNLALNSFPTSTLLHTKAVAQNIDREMEEEKAAAAAAATAESKLSVHWLAPVRTKSAATDHARTLRSHRRFA